MNQTIQTAALASIALAIWALVWNEILPHTTPVASSLTTVYYPCQREYVFAVDYVDGYREGETQ